MVQYDYDLAYPRLIRSASDFFALFILHNVIDGKGNSSKETGSGLREIIIGDDIHFLYTLHMYKEAVVTAAVNEIIQNNL